jgi:hypothetical protein
VGCVLQAEEWQEDDFKRQTARDEVLELIAVKPWECDSVEFEYSSEDG